MGRNGRVNLLIGTGHFLSHFYALCLPPLFLAWQGSFGVSYAELGMSAALMSGTTALLQTPVGFLVDRHGARRFLVGGLLLMTLAIAAMGLATSYWQILLLAVLSGIGNSVIHPVDYTIITGSVDKTLLGRAFAWHTFSGNLGFAAAPPVMAALMLAIGWRPSVLLVGAIGIPLVAAVLWQSRILNDQVHTEPVHHAGPALSGRQLLLSGSMLFFFGFYLFSSMAGAGIQSWVITVLHQVHGMRLTAASSVLTAYLVGATSGTLVGGWAADRTRRHLALVVSVTAVSAFLILVLAVVALPDAVAFGLMFVAGLALGSNRTPRDIMVKEAAPPGQIGKVFGFVSSGLPLGSALTPVPFGFLIDRGHPELVLIVVATLLLVSVFCAGSARLAGRRAAVPVAAE